LSWTSIGLVFKANKQAEGRGRLERFWDSQEGGLWVSLVIQKELPLEGRRIMGFLSNPKGITTRVIPWIFSQIRITYHSRA